MSLLSDAEVERRLAALPGWRRVGDRLHWRRTFADFDAAVAFTLEIARAAKALDHHPEWTVRYRTVEVSTTTHDAGGLTTLDFDLAASIV
jgi:4a-hydroxytetrahydrobiopterin dehydratase